MTDQPKRPRGRPKKLTDQPVIVFKEFTCVYANAVAQVYIRHAEPKPERATPGDPTRHLKVGDHFVLYILQTTHGPVQKTCPSGSTRATIYPRGLAVTLAKELWHNSDEDERFGTLEGPNAHVLYRNLHFEVQFSPATDIRRPFVVVHTSTGKVLVNGHNRIRLWSTLLAAIEVADEEANKLRSLS